MLGKFITMWCMLCCVVYYSLAQEEAPKLPPLKLLHKLNKQYENTNNRLQKQTAAYLQKLQKQEQKLKQQLAKTDSLKAEQVFGNIDDKYSQLANQLQQPNTGTKQYLKGLDSVKTTLAFLEQSKLPSPFGEGQGVRLEGLNQLSSTLHNAGNIKQQLKQRKEYLKQQLQNTPLAKQLQGMQEQVFYYQQQLNEYKELLNNPDKLVQRLMGYVRGLPAFKNFFQQNSILSQLFAVPANYGTPQSLVGLQTNAAVSNLLSQRLGVATPSNGGMPAQLQAPLQQANQQLQQIKQKFKNLTSSGGISNSNDEQWPEESKRPPNAQKTKTFLQRLQVGFNTQSQRNSNLLPSITDIAVTVGYKINNNLTTGIGTAFKLGLGNGWQNIRFTAEGLGVRSFIEGKLPKLLPVVGENLWLSANVEWNYFPTLNQTIPLTNLKIDWNAWQRSGLLGLTKKMKAGKRTIRTQLLYNLNYAQQRHITSPFVFRVGWEKN